MEVVKLLMIHLIKYAFQIKQRMLMLKLCNIITGVNEAKILVKYISCDFKQI